jgi:hypothetical protein
VISHLDEGGLAVALGGISQQKQDPGRDMLCFRRLAERGGRIYEQENQQ